MANELFKGDLPDGMSFGSSVAIDTETQGLNLQRDRLCVMQLSSGDGNSALVQFEPGAYEAPNLRALMADPGVTKMFHFARFDLAAIKTYMDVICRPVYCTKIASKLSRTYTDKHGLSELCAELLDVQMSKQQQQSDWAAEVLSDEQVEYAARDVLYLHRLREILDRRLAREGRVEIAQACFQFLPVVVEMDLAGWAEKNIFEH